MSKLNYFLIIVFVFLHSCTNSHKEEETHLRFDIDTIPVNINPKILGFYIKYSVFENESKILFAGYNYQLNQIDLLDLKNKTVYGIIPLFEEGTNAIGKLINLVLLSNSVLVETISNYYYLDYNGNILTSIKKSDIEFDGDRSLLNCGIVINNYTQLSYSLESKKIITQIFPLVLKTKPQFYTQPFVATIDLLNQKASVLDIQYPKLFLDNDNFYGDLDLPYFTIEGDSIIYSFACSSDIYIWKNQKTFENKVIGNLEDIQSEKISKQDYDDYIKRSRHTLRSTRFYNVVHDHNLNLFYRTYQIHIDDNVSFISDRETNLMIFNQNFNLIKIIELGKVQPFCFSTSLGLIFQPSAQSDEDIMSLICVKAQK
jgi:hypothetical protein